MNKKRFDRKYYTQSQYKKLESDLENKGEKKEFKLVTKKPRDSLVTLNFPFSTDEKLRDIYVTQGSGMYQLNNTKFDRYENWKTFRGFGFFCGRSGTLSNAT